MDSIGEMLFDRMDSKKEPQNKQGESIISGILIGTITDNYDVIKKDRVEVEIQIGSSGEKVKAWVKCMSPAAGKEWGIFYKPEIGDKVIVAFVNGNINSPFILGSVYQKSSNMISEYSVMLNKTKTIKTKSGSEIKIEAETQGDTISIKSKGGNEVLINDTDKTVTLTTTQNAKITVGGNESDIKIEDTHGISIVTGSSKIEMTSEGKVTIEASDFTLKATGKVAIEGNDVSVSGANINIKADAQLNMKASAGAKLETDGVAEIKGSMAKIN